MPLEKISLPAKTRVRVLKDMTMFVEVGRRESFTQAAKALSIPLSTLARRIAALEAELGIRLIDRTTRNQKLTVDGRIYFERCRHIVDDALSVYDEIHSQSHGLTGAVQVAAPSDIPSDVLADIIGRFMGVHPGLVVSIFTSNDRTVPGDHVDLVLRLGEPMEGEMITRKIGSIPLGIFAAPGYLTKHDAVETRLGLKNHGHLVSESCRKHITTLLRDVPAERINLGGRMKCDRFSFAAGLATTGLGLTVLPRLVAEPYVQSGALEEVFPGWHIPDLPLHVMMTSKMLPARVRACLSFLVRGLQTVFGGEEKETVPPTPPHHLIGTPIHRLSA